MALEQEFYSPPSIHQLSHWKIQHEKKHDEKGDNWNAFVKNQLPISPESTWIIGPFLRYDFWDSDETFVSKTLQYI